jgi:hypothetical protein
LSMTQLRQVAVALAAGGGKKVTTAGPGRNKAAVSQEIQQGLQELMQQQEQQQHSGAEAEPAR